MAARINLDDYLIKYKIDYESRLQAHFEQAIDHTIKLGLGIDKKLKEIAFSLIKGNKANIKILIRNTYTPKKFDRLGKELDDLSLVFLGRGEGDSKLTERIRLAMSNIESNVMTRFSEAPLNIITAQLINAVMSQSPKVVEYRTIGIRAGFMNKKSLNQDTPPYNIQRNKKTGEAKIVKRKDVMKKYRYKLKDGSDVDVSGYWAFQEFGTSGLRPIAKRSFILNAVRAIHGEDQKEFKNVEIWLGEQVNKFKARVKKITS
jgi:hypothetical protein